MDSIYFDDEPKSESMCIFLGVTISLKTKLNSTSFYTSTTVTMFINWLKLQTKITTNCY